ncbi:MAG: hypothetical protein AAB535_01790 [Patescibacteria group bacterium]
MTTNTKMLQMLIDGQVGIRSDIKKLDKKLTDQIDETKTSLTTRIDRLGFQIANLEEDAPTIDEFDKLTKRVVKIERKLALD